jgi:P4 family phage/plasmid primase-like protien
MTDDIRAVYAGGGELQNLHLVEPEALEPPLTSSSSVVLADIAIYRIAGTLSKLVYDEGGLWRLDDQHHIWEAVADHVIRRIIYGFDGEYYGETKQRKIAISSNKANDILKVIQDKARREKFFEEAPPGIALGSKFYSVVDRKLVACELTAEHRQRFRHEFEFEPGARPARYIDQLLTPCLELEPDRDELIQLIQEFGGACLLGVAFQYQKALVLVGDGANGKSTLQQVFAGMFPPGSVTSISPHDMSKQFRLAGLVGARLNLVSEMPRDRLLSTEELKKAIAGEQLTGERKHKPPFKFTFRGGMLFSANALPAHRDTTHGFWRRWAIIPFRRRFTRDEQVLDLANHILEAELPAIVSWHLTGAAILADRASGYWIPGTSHKRSSEWRKDADQVVAFITDKCRVLEPGNEQAWAGARDLYQAYQSWAAETGHSPLSSTSFGRRIKELQEVEHCRNSANTIIYSLEIKPSWQK